MNFPEFHDCEILCQAANDAARNAHETAIKCADKDTYYACYAGALKSELHQAYLTIQNLRRDLKEVVAPGSLIAMKLAEEETR